MIFERTTSVTLFFIIIFYASNRKIRQNTFTFRMGPGNEKSCCHGFWRFYFLHYYTGHWAFVQWKEKVWIFFSNLTSLSFFIKYVFSKIFTSSKVVTALILKEVSRSQYVLRPWWKLLINTSFLHSTTKLSVQMSMIYRMFFTKTSINIYNDNILLELRIWPSSVNIPIWINK